MVVLTAGFILQSITIKKHISLMQKVDFRRFFVYISYVLFVCIRMYACVTCMYIRMQSACIRMLPVCCPFVTRMFSVFVRMLSVCIRMLPYVVRTLPVCCPYVSVCHPYVVRMFFVCCPYVTCMYPCVSVRRWCVTQCMLPVCARVLF